VTLSHATCCCHLPQCDGGTHGQPDRPDDLAVYRVTSHSSDQYSTQDEYANPRYLAHARACWQLQLVQVCYHPRHWPPMYNTVVYCKLPCRC
jgi:hypothetical protein